MSSRKVLDISFSCEWYLLMQIRERFRASHKWMYLLLVPWSYTWHWTNYMIMIRIYVDMPWWLHGFRLAWIISVKALSRTNQLWCKWHHRRHESTDGSGWVNRSCFLPNTAYPSFKFHTLYMLKSPHGEIDGSIMTLDYSGPVFGTLQVGGAVLSLLGHENEAKQ